jgi:methionyl aminopeptidase
MIYIKTPTEIDRIREACRLVAATLEEARKWVNPGVTTAEIDSKIERFIRAAGGTPAFLGYQGFPGSSCVSINDEVVHGIPSKKRSLKDGDIVGIDIGVKLDGFFGDAARTFPVGKVTKRVEELLEVTREALDDGVREARPGNRVGDISAAIQRRAEAGGVSIVRNLVGHGVGKHLHEEPAVPNFGKKGEGALLEPGMVLAIEPMLNLGTHEVRTLLDGWTIVTIDGSYSAHFEHTVAILEAGPEALTLTASDFEKASQGIE